MNICVLIPTFNEGEAIAGLIKKVSAQNLEVIVVDDGSKDNTSEIARRNNATVLQNQSNQGKGASLIKGFAFVLNKGFDAVITMDGDGQHAPEDLPNFISAAQHSDGGIFIGNRMAKTKTMPPVRYFTNKFMSWLISKVAKQNIPDTQCGFRLIRKEVLEKLNLKTSKYETESEILIEASRSGFKIESVPIKTLYLNEKSHINPFVDTLRFLKFISKELWTTRN
ncbi:MAG: glycosyltransferase family 2 protein [Candidatus Omnitrophica bacterium]|nr:glycosyltransferase family 2 protein [Candidatus Omnitrophota bacterium]